jgi:hypothetical protein
MVAGLQILSSGFLGSIQGHKNMKHRNILGVLLDAEKRCDRANPATVLMTSIYSMNDWYIKSFLDLWIFKKIVVHSV